METVDIIAQVISLFTTLAAVLAVQLKDMRYILVCQILSNVLLCVQYALQGSASSYGVVIIAIVQAVLSYALSARGVRFPVWLTGLFIVGYTAVTALTFSSVFDILPCLAVWLFAIAVVQSRSYIYRILLVGNSLLWLAFDIAAAPSGIIPHVVILGFSIVGIIRLDIPEWKRVLGRGSRDSEAKK